MCISFPSSQVEFLVYLYLHIYGYIFLHICVCVRVMFCISIYVFRCSCAAISPGWRRWKQRYGRPFPSKDFLRDPLPKMSRPLSTSSDGEATEGLATAHVVHHYSRSGGNKNKHRNLNTKTKMAATASRTRFDFIQLSSQLPSSYFLCYASNFHLKGEKKK